MALTCLMIREAQLTIKKCYIAAAAAARAGPSVRPPNQTETMPRFFAPAPAAFFVQAFRPKASSVLTSSDTFCKNSDAPLCCSSTRRQQQPLLRSGLSFIVGPGDNNDPEEQRPQKSNALAF